MSCKLGERSIMKKKILLFAILILVMFGTSGCMENYGVARGSMKSYLKDKYNAKFTYVSAGRLGWPAKDVYTIFKDEDGNELEIHSYVGDSIFTKKYSDNYYSVIYDKQVQDQLQLQLDSQYKIFISTKREFTIGKEKYDNAEDYMRACLYVYIAICTTEDPDFDKIYELLLNEMSDVNMSVSVYTLTEEGFDTVSEYPDYVKYGIKQSDIIYRDSFVIKENEVQDNN